MISSRIKNNIYALISLSVIIITLTSFAYTANFLVKINNLIFNFDQKLISEKTTTLDEDSFNAIKDKLEKNKVLFQNIINNN